MAKSQCKMVSGSLSHNGISQKGQQNSFFKNNSASQKFGNHSVIFPPPPNQIPVVEIFNSVPILNKNSNVHPDITNFLQKNEVRKSEDEFNCLIRTQNRTEKSQIFSQDPLIYPTQDIAIEKIRDPLNFEHENFKVQACQTDHQNNEIRELQEKSLPFHNESELKYRNWYGH